MLLRIPGVLDPEARACCAVLSNPHCAGVAAKPLPTPTLMRGGGR